MTRLGSYINLRHMSRMTRWLLGESGSSGTDDAVSKSSRMAAELAAELELLGPFELPTVVAARTLCADTVAMMQMAGVTGPTAERLDPLPAVLRQPDPAEPYGRTLRKIVDGMTRHGRSWLKITARRADGFPLALRYVDDSRVNAQTDLGGRIIAIAIDGVPLAPVDVLHIPMRQEAGDPLGVSPLEEIRTALAQLAEVYRYSAGYYSTASVPPYAVIHPNRLTPEQAQDFADQWMIARAENRPAVLSGGIDIQTYNRQSANDAMLLDAVAMLNQTIARVLLIPPSLLNVTSSGSLTYSTVSGEFQRWLSIGLFPMFLAPIQEAFSTLLPRGQSAIFDTSNLTRMDFPGRIAAYAESISAGIHTKEEVRALEGLPTVPDPAPQPIAANVEGL